MSLLSSLSTAKNALNAQTMVLNVISHNVANANTEGYSRQTATLTALSSGSTSSAFGYSSTGVVIGNGVEVTSVARSRSALYDEMYWSENQSYNYYNKLEELFSQVESLIDEPSDDGLSALIDDFYNAWEDLSDNADDLSAREALKSTAEELASRFQRIYSELETMRGEIDTEISTIPTRINEITSEIAALNSSIMVASTEGTSANDLMDQRDLLIDELSEYSDVQVVAQDDGSYTVLIGSNVVVDHDMSVEIEAVTSVATEDEDALTVLRSTDGTEYTPDSGTIGALIWFRDEVITGIEEKLNDLAASIVESVNAVHETGYGLDGGTGREFFDSTNTKAYNISLSSDIDDAGNIAASGTGEELDGSIALAISQLTEEAAVNGTYTVSEYYNALVSDIGIMSSEAQSNQSNTELLVSQIDSSRESVKGVSVDEELVAMIQAQHVYQAASRVITTIDSLLETLINM